MFEATVVLEIIILNLPLASFFFVKLIVMLIWFTIQHWSTDRIHTKNLTSQTLSTALWAWFPIVRPESKVTSNDYNKF